MNPWSELKSEIAKATGGKVEYPKQADLAVPCFKMGGNPVETASKLAKVIKIKNVEVKAQGPYLNFYIDWSKFGQVILKGIKKDYGKGSEKEKIMVEFAHPNTHKGFHIGHVRNICIGSSLCNILEWRGNKVIRTNYQGDVGPHISKVLWGLENLNLKPPKTGKAKWLGEVYAKASSALKDKEDEIKKITADMYDGKLSKELVKLWKETRDWSLQYFDAIYKDFGVKYDRLYFESELTEKGKEYSLELLKKGVAKKSEGAIVVDLTAKDLGVAVLITKQGYALYNAKELYLAELQFGEFKPDKIIHVVAVPQTLFFKQLFELHKHHNPEWSKKSFHLSYELVGLKGEKMASRLGNVVLYDELIEKIRDKISEKSKKNVQEISMAALKYGMLKYDNNRKILFDWEASLQIKGDTGPYLQYTYARASSILKKGGAGKIGELAKEEVKLLKMLAIFPEIVERSANEWQPHHLANYLHELSEEFNSYYQSTKVIGSELEKERLALVEKIKIVLGIGLGLLGIETLEEM
jgi:arginyl-tRNA synthetase